MMETIYLYRYEKKTLPELYKKLIKAILVECHFHLYFFLFVSAWHFDNFYDNDANMW